MYVNPPSFFSLPCLFSLTLLTKEKKKRKEKKRKKKRKEKKKKKKKKKRKKKEKKKSISEKVDFNLPNYQQNFVLNQIYPIRRCHISKENFGAEHLRCLFGSVRTKSIRMVVGIVGFGKKKKKEKKSSKILKS